MKRTRIMVCLLLGLLLALSPAAALGGNELLKLDVPTWEHSSDTLEIRITMHQEQYSTKGILTYFVAEIHVEDPRQLFSAFASDEYSRNGTEDTESIAERNSAILATNGDYYNHDNSLGTILRNGELYREKDANRDLLVIDQEGNLDVVLRDERKGDRASEVTGVSLVADQVWQTYEFGPALIRDGVALELPDKYFISTSENIREPRTVIGQISPLHYIILIADGRRENWSTEGMRFSELQEVLLDYGCEVAYNLDGGGSTTLYFKGEILNKPAGGRQRSVSDIIGFRE